jgi:PAS domain S-box-containing protein
MINSEREILNLIDVACLQLDAECKLIYMNRKAAELFNLDARESIGRDVWRYFNPDLCKEASKAIEDAIFRKQQTITEYFCLITETWMSLNTTPAKEGVILMFTEITEITLTKYQLLEERTRLKLAQRLGQIGYFEGLLNLEELYCSDELYCIYGLRPQEKKLSFDALFHYAHPEDQLEIRKSIKERINSRKPFEFVQRIVNARKAGKVINIKIEFLTGCSNEVDRVCGVIQDITSQYLAKEELKESKNLLQSVFDTSLIGMALLKAEKNPDGEIKDFRYQVVSKEMEKESGRKDLPGKLFTKEYPGVKKAGLFELMLKVMATGNPEQFEYHYPYDGFDKWYCCMFVKKDDAIVISNLDISKRKSAELEQYKNLALLQQSEELAKTGSWDYDLISGVFTLSEGMYRLFNIPSGQVVSPEIYL